MSQAFMYLKKRDIISVLVAKLLDGVQIKVCLGSNTCRNCGLVQDTKRGEWAYVKCENEWHVTNQVILLSHGKALTFCELEIYGKPNGEASCL